MGLFQGGDQDEPAWMTIALEEKFQEKGGADGEKRKGKEGSGALRLDL